LATTNEQVANIIELTKIEEKLDSFIQKNPELQKLVPSEKEVQVEYEKQLELMPLKTKQLIISNPSLQLVKKREISNTILTKKIKESEEFKALLPEKKQEFDAILIDVYRYNEKVSPELNEMYFPDMKAEIEQKEREINQISLNISESFSDSQKIVLENKEFNNYFKDHYINEFVSEEQKDQSYRDNLQKLYPNSKNIIQASFS